MTLPKTIKRGFIRTMVVDCVDNITRYKTLEYIISELSNGKKVFQLIGGPTGYESFYIEKGTREEYIPEHVKCWVACMGTKNVYDRMEVPREEMLKMLDGVVI